MAKQKMHKQNKTCRDRCEFKAKNCWMSEDGTWDCSTKLEDCFDKCRIR
jgi:hypothetical protein